MRVVLFAAKCSSHAALLLRELESSIFLADGRAKVRRRLALVTASAESEAWGKLRTAAQVAEILLLLLSLSEGSKAGSDEALRLGTRVMALLLLELREPRGVVRR